MLLLLAKQKSDAIKRQELLSLRGENLCYVDEYYSPPMLPFLWWPAGETTSWAAAMAWVGAKEKRWAVTADSEKDPNRMTLMEYFLLKQKVGTTWMTRALGVGVNGAALVPPLLMDEYFNSAIEPPFTAPPRPISILLFFSSLPTWESNGGGVFSSRCELNVLLHTEVQEDCDFSSILDTFPYMWRPNACNTHLREMALQVQVLFLTLGGEGKLWREVSNTKVHRRNHQQPGGLISQQVFSFFPAFFF